jgi:hypothetical protein
VPLHSWTTAAGANPNATVGLGLVTLPGDFLTATATRRPTGTRVAPAVIAMVLFLIVAVAWLVAWIAWAAA